MEDKMNSLYNTLIRTQTELIGMLTEQQKTFESKGDTGIQYSALTNEINTLTKNLNAIKLFYTVK